MSSKRTKKIAVGIVLVGALVAGPITLAHTSAFAGSGAHSGGSRGSNSSSDHGNRSGYHGSYGGYNSSYRGGLGRNPNNDTSVHRDNSHYDSRYQDQFAEH